MQAAAFAVAIPMRHSRQHSYEVSALPALMQLRRQMTQSLTLMQPAGMTINVLHVAAAEMYVDLLCLLSRHHQHCP